jgi:hypothetical protein
MTNIRVPAYILSGIAGLALIAAQATAQTASFEAAKVVKPLAGLSFDVGSKRAVGYYAVQDGSCDLTLLVGDAQGEAEEAVTSIPARFSALIEAGRSARIDAGQGKRVEFLCAANAETLLTRVVEQIAYVAPARN